VKRTKQQRNPKSTCEEVQVHPDAGELSQLFTSSPASDSCIHFVGVGGIGMSAVAMGFLMTGCRVSGSDMQLNNLTTRLKNLGCTIYQGHRREHVRRAQAVVVSSAVQPDNVEITEARRRAIPIIHRSQAAQMLLQNRRTVAVSGTHGKTTISGMIGMLLTEAGFDPLVFLGGELDPIGGNMRFGKGHWAVTEADESDRSFTNLRPEIAVINNVDLDHVDSYAGIEDVGRSFQAFAESLTPGGCCFIGWDSTEARKLATELSCALVTYGSTADADLYLDDYQGGVQSSSFQVYRGKTLLGGLNLSVPGRFNAVNSLAALGVGLHLDIPFRRIVEVLHEFPGVKRRFERKGTHRGVTIVDDYAHHPEEIRATLSALSERFPGRKVGVFQPHRYSRTRAFAADFARALECLDGLVLTDVYGAGEEPIDGVSGRNIFEAMTNGQGRVHYAECLEEIPDILLSKVLQEGDVLITLGAGDVWQVGEELLQRLKKREGEKDA
jgi:UDP-N-acetylmuramate--alanine ligase